MNGIKLKRESQIQKEIVDFLKSKKIYFLKIHGSGFSRKGAPDIIICYKGLFIGLEVKAENGRLSTVQKLNIAEIFKSDGFCETVRSVDDVKRVLEKAEDYAFKNSARANAA